MTNPINAKASDYLKSRLASPDFDGDLYPVDVYDAWLSGYEARKQDTDFGVKFSETHEVPKDPHPIDYDKKVKDFTAAIQNSESYCISGLCKSTNWQGHDRLHFRFSDCPEFDFKEISEYLEQAKELAQSAKTNPTSEATHRHVVIGFRYDYHYNSNRVVVSCDHIDCNESFEFPAPVPLSKLPDVVGLYVIDHGWVNMPNDVANNTYWDD